MSLYYQDEAVTIYHGDCREIVLGLGRFDLLLTDPPYGIGLGSHADAKEKRAGVGLKKQQYASYDDTIENLRATIVPVIKDCLSISERALVFCAGHRMWEFPVPSAVSAIYIPCGQGRTPWGFQNLAHFMLYGSAPNLNLGAKNTVLRSTESSENNGHPCPKPIGWMTWCVSLASLEGDTILDPFAGSGTTGRAAKDLGRKAVLIEREEKYCEIAARRMAQEVFTL
jgi:site-specific DNA-methyltransferase (adenine-specific)